ncbi:MAG TPA: phosphodiester glycosidase family protein [Gemmatimonadales bacterium]
MRRAALPLAAAGSALALAAVPTLSVERDGRWHTWWRQDSAPVAWEAALPEVAGAVAWEAAGPGVELGTLRISGAGEAWRIRVIAVRLDPARLSLRLAAPPPGRGAPNRWTVDHAPADAVLALNAGQFGSGGAWGWVVRGGIERQRPGTGPLAPAIVVDSAGRLRIVPPDSIPAVRAAGTAVEAFQSYPMILEGEGAIPSAIRDAGAGVDLEHRDARLAIGELRDGRVLLALTRFEGLGGVLESLPFGLTTPEMAAVMGALGARRAVLLDGGISSQLLVRTPAGERAWRGMRYVPLGLTAMRR